MVHRVLLVDPNVEALANLAQALRRRGLKVQIANSTAMACDRVKQAPFDAVIAWHELAVPSGESLGLLDALVVETGRALPFILLVDDAATMAGHDRALRTDIEGIFARLVQIPAIVEPKPPAAEPVPAPSLAPVQVARAHSSPSSSLPPEERSSTSVRVAPVTSSAPPFLAGFFSRTPLRDLLTVLSAERRTGTLTVTTAQGAGELRIHEGELVDAVYLRLEGMKAVARLLAERDGSFSFLPRTPPVMRRINAPLAELLGTCDDLIARASAARVALGDLEKKALFASEGAAGPPSGDFSDLARAVLTRLRTPATIDDVLEEMNVPDADVLLAIRELDAAGRIKRLSHDAERVPLVGAEALHEVRALAARAKAPGFEGAARVVFAGTPGRLAVIAHSALSIVDTVAAPDGPPAVPAPHTLASVRLGDDVSIDLVALPLVPAYGPLWPMALAGSAVVVRVDDAAAEPLAEACAAAGVPTVDAWTVVPSFDEGNASLVAAVVRAALEGLG